MTLFFFPTRKTNFRKNAPGHIGLFFGHNPAGYALKPVLADALSLLPKNSGEKAVFLR
jgi:hypothetical protein